MGGTLGSLVSIGPQGMGMGWILCSAVSIDPQGTGMLCSVTLDTPYGVGRGGTLGGVLLVEKVVLPEYPVA